MKTTARNGKRLAAAAGVALALGLGLSGCGSDGDEGAAGPVEETATPQEEHEDEGEGEGAREPEKQPPSPSEERTSEERTSEEPPPEEGGVDACFDLDCEITVTEGTDIPADGEYGITLVTVESVTADDVTIEASGPGIGLGCGGSPPGSCELNGVLVEYAVTGGGNSVSLAFTP